MAFFWCCNGCVVGGVSGCVVNNSVVGDGVVGDGVVVVGGIVFVDFFIC